MPPFCKELHSPSLCSTATDSKQCIDIECQDRFCFNCLGYHKISSCNLKHHCTTAAINIIQTFVPLDTRVIATHLPLQSTLYKQQSNTTALPPSLVQLQSAGVHSVTSQSTGVHPTSSVQLLTYCSTYWCTLS